MATSINCEVKKELIPKALEDILPGRLIHEISSLGIRGIEEIRIRRTGATALTVYGRSIRLNTVIEPHETDEIFTSMCSRSVYAHTDTIRKGYLTLDGGMRVGLCGRAVVEGERIIGLSTVTGINIRIPTQITDVGEPICDILRSFSGGEGVLVYSPPAEGKTTLLRSVASKMAGGERPWRVCVVDSRRELAPSLDSRELMIDVLSGYPKGMGIEIATRTMNPQLIVCDEIGDVTEARAILGAVNCGVSVLASAHGRGVRDVFRREGLAEMHRAHVFGAYVGIKRRRYDYIYDVATWEEADALFKNIG